MGGRWGLERWVKVGVLFVEFHALRDHQTKIAARAAHCLTSDGHTEENITKELLEMIMYLVGAATDVSVDVSVDNGPSIVEVFIKHCRCSV